VTDVHFDANNLLDERDIEQTRAIGKNPQELFEELSMLREGPRPPRLLRPCRIGDGIQRLSEAQRDQFAQVFMSGGDTAVKFVAASGAASRMFDAELQAALHPSLTRAELDSAASRGEVWAEEFTSFFRNLPRFAFFENLRQTIAANGLDLDKAIKEDAFCVVLDFLLTSKGLDYGSRPKGLIPFHRYPEGPRTAFEEHLVEWQRCVRGRPGAAGIHFTVPPAFVKTVDAHVREAEKRFATDQVHLDIEVSPQDSSTDAVCVNMENHPARDVEGNLLFRPAGHGALLLNFNSLEADLIFIRTIDNILPEPQHETVCCQKHVLGGYAISLRQRISECLMMFEAGDDAVEKACNLVASELNVRLPRDFGKLPRAELKEFLFRRLNRPLRVCAMVRHRGEPGGGPFWVMDADGMETIQIVEGAQVDSGDESQLRIWREAGFFNPVDMVCAVRDYRGRKFDLMAFCDPHQRIVAFRNAGGQKVKFLECPGLWNGGMANWNSVFVEMSRDTLRPVKKITDLL